MSEGEKQVIVADDVGDAAEVVGDMRPITTPGQVIESSRKLDTHLTTSIDTLRRSSLSSKISSLSEDMADFERESHVVVDGIRDKIADTRLKRDEAKAAQHAYYDGLIGDFQETIDSVRRLSNLPLGGGGKQ